jgi:hypothetical protein
MYDRRVCFTGSGSTSHLAARFGRIQEIFEISRQPELLKAADLYLSTHLAVFFQILQQLIQ